MTKREREITDSNKIEEILNSCVYLHLGLVDDGKPYVVPMNYGVAKDEKDGHTIVYLHGALKGRKLDIIRKNPECCFTMERNVQAFDGNLPCQYGTAYECLMGTGKIYIVDDIEEKKKSLTALMLTQTGKDFTFDDKMASIVSVMRIDVEEIAAKYRPLPASLSM